MVSYKLISQILHNLVNGELIAKTHPFFPPFAYGTYALEGQPKDEDEKELCVDCPPYKRK